MSTYITADKIVAFVKKALAHKTIPTFFAILVEVFGFSTSILSVLILLQRQHLNNKGKCGVCGDQWDLPAYPNEPGPGNVYATGMITKTYTQGQYSKLDRSD